MNVIIQVIALGSVELGQDSENLLLLRELSTLDMTVTSSFNKIEGGQGRFRGDKPPANCYSYSPKTLKVMCVSNLS
jgi:hypothetical protein